MHQATSRLLCLVGLLAAAPTANAATKAVLKGADLMPQASVSLSEAKHAALKARPGKVADEELEKENGGSGLRYSFDISDHGKIYEVGVDARTGAVLEDAAEGKNPD